MPISLPPISRRRFLAGSLAIGAGAFLPRSLAAAEAKVDPDLFVLMGDTHLMPREEDSHRNVKPAEAFRQATMEILSLPTRPSGLIIAGDCAEGNRGGYDTFREAIKPFQKAGMPLRIAFGNHDNRDKFRATFPKVKFLPIGDEQGKPPSKLVWLWETPQANWFLLDSAIRPGVGAGNFGAAQLAWLAKALDARADKPALLVAHHHPDPTGKFNGLTDTGPFLKVILPRKQVKAYFYGHTHFWGLTELSGVHLVNLPVMAWPFDPSQPRGYVALRLRPDGTTLVLHTLDHNDARNGQKIELAWRK